MADRQPKKDRWSTEAYASSASFVPTLTTRVLTLLDPQPDDHILDVGCGDGALTAQIGAKCESIVGLDVSPAFVRTARQRAVKGESAENAAFHERDCRRLEVGSRTDEGLTLASERFDKVFSNAALHWILRDETTRKGFFDDVHALLKPGGCFVFEMGGAGNVAEVHTALMSVLQLSFELRMSIIRAADPWFFPSEQWTRNMLTEAGFKGSVVEIEYRPTKLDLENGHGGGGLAGWVKLMGASFLELLAHEDERAKAVSQVVELLSTIVTRDDGSQWLGYVRLRAKTWKQSPESDKL